MKSMGTCMLYPKKVLLVDWFPQIHEFNLNWSKIVAQKTIKRSICQKEKNKNS